eukprot:CAMPEP_0113818998 /NCGR_PEP_ID=MMETSP0328-20130328/520_1 /TAXON_ID=39455 /ORGANISM="Alexandrium minutum" /LENGTH=288 /DNA_ID=CAMNT_0000786933 /DNA_START=83 /DNA_END=945 /DNA_ORIENTATION=- /assembly_acc=CAM_ASM_000350
MSRTVMEERRLPKMKHWPRRLTGIALLAAIASQFPHGSPPASFIASSSSSSPGRGAESVTQRRAQQSAADAAPSRGLLQLQIDALLEDDASARRGWKAFCRKAGLEPAAALKDLPAEALGSFLAEPSSYKQSTLLEFLDNVRRPVVGLDSIDEDDPITKSGLVRELTVKHLKALLEEDSDMGRRWSKCRARKLAQLLAPDEDAARAEMAMRASFARAKKIEPGTMEALAAKEAYYDGRNTMPGFDLDGGRDAAPLGRRAPASRAVLEMPRANSTCEHRDLDRCECSGP